jgi:GDP/UDP-N,N'-diacetylbacillosamine 2-epimerase (hydrolysing)
VKNRRRICVVTGTRAEYGLLRHLMGILKDSVEFNLQIIATGTHLEDRFGATYQEIEKDGFKIHKKVHLNLQEDTPTALSRSTALGLQGFAEAFKELAPDIVLVLGDRFELLSVAIAAMFARIPIVHLHGGELTEGAIDEAIRHSLTKFSHLHFVAHEEYRKRVIQLGESPETVFNVGGMGIDGIRRMHLMGRDDLERSLGLKFLAKNLLVTFHPVTLEKGSSGKQMSELLEALAELSDTRIIFTMPNADGENSIIFDLIKSFVHKFDNAVAFESLGHLRYLSCVAQVDGVVGNSSSGLMEVPSFRKGTVNIGDRQRGRLQASSVINVEPEKLKILTAIARLYDPTFQKQLLNVTNPYGDGGASERIVQVLKESDFGNLLKKKFFDLSIP